VDGYKDFTFHDLRHTFASRLVMAGVDVPTVQALMGHKTITMTLRYTHLTNAHKRQAVQVLERIGQEVPAIFTTGPVDEQRASSQIVETSMRPLSSVG
jgi:hypothetical protein